ALDADRGDAGSWMCMPYFGGDFGGKLKMQHGIKKHGEDMTLTEFLAAAEKKLTTVADLKAAAAKVEAGVGGRTSNKPKRGDGAAPPAGDFSDGPPCLQRLTQQPMEEGRKRTLFMMALYYWKSDRDNWEARVGEANQKFFRPPLSPEEVSGITR